MTWVASVLLAWAIITGTPADATWIHPSLEGGITKSGEVYRQDAYTCAANRFPLGSILRVTNRETGRNVVCQVNDTGLMPGYDIDLSRAAFERIGELGEGRIRVVIEEVN